ncbi:hypothetical protein MMC13_003805 [Lambiella insularis]|nr:hypothetical protein [Lambiella insularis]
MSGTNSPASQPPDSASCTSSPLVPQAAPKKRKRESKPVEEIEVDIDAPEPPSKKSLRKLKKAKPAVASLIPKPDADGSASDADGRGAAQEPTPTQRSEYGIWIGNLPWVASKADLRKFLTSNADIEDDSITRIHMPAPTQPPIEAARQKIKPQNTGFAYVDFSNESTMAAALALSETLLSGRRVLIKNAKSFEGRPEPVKKTDEGPGLQDDKPPSKRVFVGNLAFDTTKDELHEHFAKCGQVADCFVATFEDTGKCKGYAWVTFEETEAAAKAVRGWVDMVEAEQTSADEFDEDRESRTTSAIAQKKSKKVRKWWVNRIKGRPLRMEFAEDKAVRYKKRYGRGASKGSGDAHDNDDVTPILGIADGNVNTPDQSKTNPKSGHVQEAGSKIRHRAGGRIDARTIKPGAALAGAQRLTGAILPSQGKKTVFD